MNEMWNDIYNFKNKIVNETVYSIITNERLLSLKLFICRFLHYIYIIICIFIFYWNCSLFHTALYVHFDWFTYWLIDWLIDWSIDWPTDWLTDWLSAWLIDRLLINLLIEWLIHWLSNWLTQWLAKWFIDWLTDWFTHWLTYWS